MWEGKKENNLIDLLVLIMLCTMFAYVVQSRTCCYTSTREGIKKDLQSRIVFWGILVAFILFAGLRSKYNDTSTYIIGFKMIDATNLDFSILLKEYGGFDLYQKIIKIYISTDPQVFIFITAIMTNILYLVFFTRHTSKFGEMIYLYAIGNYTFCMAGLKQAIAVGISLYAIENYLNGKYVRAIFLLFLAMTFHPYIVCLICVPFLKDKIWDGKTIIVIAVCILAFMNMEKVFELFSLIGKDYSNTDLDSYTINPLRALINAVPVGLSFFYRKKINKSADRILILGLNMRIISFVFIAMGLFVNPIYFGRMATYFTALSTVAIPKMLSIAWKKSRNKRVYTLGYYLFFFIYFLMDMTKIGSISIFTDQFNHVPLSSIFSGKGV